MASARRHGIPDDDILHAWRMAMILHELDGYIMVVGPSQSGQLIEIAVNANNEIFHADRARPKFL